MGNGTAPRDVISAVDDKTRQFLDHGLVRMGTFVTVISAMVFGAWTVRGELEHINDGIATSKANAEVIAQHNETLLELARVIERLQLLYHEIDRNLVGNRGAGFHKRPHMEKFCEDNPDLDCSRLWTDEERARYEAYLRRDAERPFRAWDQPGD